MIQKYQTFNDYLKKVFFIMTIGLICSFIAAYFSIESGFTERLLKNYKIFYIILTIEFSIALTFGFLLKKLTNILTWFFFLLYSIVTGVSLSFIPFIYNGESIFLALIGTIILFITMTVFSILTKTDFTSFTSFFFIGILSLIALNIVNLLFFKSRGFDLFLAYIGVLLFLGLIVYDIQKLRSFYETTEEELLEKIAVYGAFTLYLDFVNIFLKLLKILGRKSRS